jgi:serine/threonine protein kinase
MVPSVSALSFAWRPRRGYARPPTDISRLEDSVDGVAGSKDDEIGTTRRVRKIAPMERLARVTQPVRVERDYPAELQSARKACLDAGGEAFGPYVLLGEVGKGGMAEVRLAIEILGVGGIRLCVIKRTKSGREEDGEAALRDEARILRRLHHPNIVELHASDTIEDRTYLAFELVDGLSLRQVRKMFGSEKLPLSNVLEIAAEAAEALAYVHAAKDSLGAPLHIVHRDISPENVLVSREGRVKVVDFGIARYAGRGPETKGFVKGKLGYLAPEQLSVSSGAIGAHTDVFSLGLVVAELVAGKRLFPPKLMAIVNAAPVVRDRCRGAPEGLIDLLVDMTATDPKARPSAETAARKFRALGQAVEPAPCLSDLARTKLFTKLLPLDLATLFELPTKRAKKLGAAEDEESEAGPPYSSAIVALERACRGR